MTIFVFFNDIELSLGAKLVSTKMTHLRTLQRVSGSFQADARKKKRCCILHEAAGGTPRQVCRNFREKNRRSDLPVFNIKQNLAKKMNPTQKPINFKEITYLVFTHKGPSVHAVLR